MDAEPDVPSGDGDAVAAAFDQLPIIAAMYEGPDQIVTAANAAARAVFGNIAGQHLTDATSEVRVQQGSDLIRKTFETGRTFTGRERGFVVAGPDGRSREVVLDLTMTPVHWPDGSMRGAVASAVDVTDFVHARHEAEAVSELMQQSYVDTQELLLTLQDALLPNSVPVLPGVDLSAHYLLAEADTSAGGDWYDALPLDDRHVALVVGDVVGHGVEASAVMGQLRAVLGERLRSGAGIENSLRALDDFAQHNRQAHTATVCVAVLDPTTREVRYCTAGHPPPLVVSAAGTASYLAPTGGGPLVTGSTFPVGDHALGAGDVLLLYTDGIIERPGRSTSQNSVEFAQAARDAVHQPTSATAVPHRLVERACRLPIEALTRLTGYDDDITLLAAQCILPIEPVELTLPATPDMIRTARGALGEWLGQLGVQDLDEMALTHAVNELASNVVDHAYQGRAITSEQVLVTARLRPDGVAELVVRDWGRWRPHESDAGRGRGLVMAGDFVDHLVIEGGDTGTTATARRRLSRPVHALSSSRPMPVPRRREPAELSIQDVNGLVEVRGALDSASADLLRNHLERRVKAGTETVTVDLSGVTLLASAAVQVLVETAAKFSTEGRGRTLRLIAPIGGAAQHVLELVRIPYESGRPPGNPVD